MGASSLSSRVSKIQQGPRRTHTPPDTDWCHVSTAKLLHEAAAIAYQWCIEFSGGSNYATRERGNLWVVNCSTRSHKLLE